MELVVQSQPAHHPLIDTHQHLSIVGAQQLKAANGVDCDGEREGGGGRRGREEEGGREGGEGGRGGREGGREGGEGGEDHVVMYVHGNAICMQRSS